jgi:hypothetical protein
MKVSVSYIYALGISILPLSTIFLLDVGTVAAMWKMELVPYVFIYL